MSADENKLITICFFRFIFSIYFHLFIASKICIQPRRYFFFHVLLRKVVSFEGITVAE